MEIMEVNQIAHREVTQAIREVKEERGEWVSLRKLYKEVNQIFSLEREWVDEEVKELIQSKNVIKDFHAEAGQILLWVGS